MTLTNEGEQSVSFHVCGSPNGGAADAPIPEWLDVHPTSGDLQPQVCTIEYLDCESFGCVDYHCILLLHTSIGAQDTSALLRLQIRFTSAAIWLRRGNLRRLPVPVCKVRIARYNTLQRECKQGPTEYLCWVQASVSIQVSAALSENVYSRRAAVAELVVIASDEFGRGLGRYERQAKDQIGFTVNCKTAGCVVVGDL